jgi:proline iminopeptidase
MPTPELWMFRRERAGAVAGGASRWDNCRVHRDAPGPVARQGFVGDGLARLYVRDVGYGVPVVVVHGGPDFDHEYLLPEMDRLAGSFHLVYYDQRGRGRSLSGEPPEDITIATEADDLDRVRRWFGFESIAVLGHSWGALLAMEYAIRNPERVSHLILMNTAPASRTDAVAFRDELARRRSPAQTKRINELRSDPRFQAGDIDTEAEYYRIHFSTTLRNPDHLEAVLRRLRSAFTENGIVAARAIEDKLYAETWTSNHYDLIPALHRLDIPTLIIHGDTDFVPTDVARGIADAIPGSRLVVLPDCGHFAYLEQPDQTSTTITTFLTTF